MTQNQDKQMDEKRQRELFEKASNIISDSIFDLVNNFAKLYSKYDDKTPREVALITQTCIEKFIGCTMGAAATPGYEKEALECCLDELSAKKENIIELMKEVKSWRKKGDENG